MKADSSKCVKTNELTIYYDELTIYTNKLSIFISIKLNEMYVY